MLTITPIPALNDNYIWTIVHSGSREAIVVDPGQAEPVIHFLKEQKLKLSAILITHHHWDHTQGIEGLLRFANTHELLIYGGALEPIPDCNRPLQQDDSIHFSNFDLTLRIMEIPGHTHGHIAYVGPHFVFTGDTLFTGGCGRLFEGTAAQMWHSLQLLAHLAPETLIYCGHEYTEANLEFAKHVEPNNSDLLKRIDKTRQLRSQGLPTVPSTLGLELKTNPFLRCSLPSVKLAVEHYCQRQLHHPVEVFGELRRWKDGFRL